MVYNSRDKINEYQRNRYKLYPERQAEYSKRWAIRYPDKVVLNSKKQYNKNKEKVIERSCIWRQNNPEKIRISNKKWRDKNPEKLLKANIRHLEKYGKTFDMNPYEFSYAFQSWSKTVKKRDWRKCQICNSTKNINAHHIFQKNIQPQLSLNVNNGITLCKKCHGKTHGFEIYEGRR